jgi:hypothetical protein
MQAEFHSCLQRDALTKRKGTPFLRTSSLARLHADPQSVHLNLKRGACSNPPRSCRPALQFMTACRSAVPYILPKIKTGCVHRVNASRLLDLIVPSSCGIR